MDAVSLDVLKFVQVLLGRGWHWCEHDAQLLLHPVDHDLAVRFEADRLLARTRRTPQTHHHVTDFEGPLLALAEALLASFHRPRGSIPH
jgi:hypothetical protein